MSIGTEFATRQLSVADVEAEIIDLKANPLADPYAKMWWEARTTWPLVRYRRVPCLKCPLDLWVYHELIQELRPALIVETGTAFGGTALYLADQLRLAGLTDSRVLTVDLTPRDHDSMASVSWDTSGPMLTRILGDCLSDEVVDQVWGAVRQAAGPVLVSLDSDHGAEHVAREMALYAPMVTPGSFLVVEDTNLGGHPVEIGVEDGGPIKAVEAFLVGHPEFYQDVLCERFVLTMHPGGWLRRRVDA